MDILRFITAGSVDDGKSTLIGRLLYDSKSILADQLEAVERSTKNKDNGEIDLALLTDGLRAEREQGITIDVAYRYFSTPKRKFIIADAPGHVQYTRNMITGASNANAIVVLIDARLGVLEQTKRHSIIASLLKVPQVIVTVNKMDLVDFAEDVFNDIVATYGKIAMQLGLKNVAYIPISAKLGDNIVDKSTQMDWYKGTCLLDLLETIEVNQALNLDNPRFQVQYVIRPQTEALHDYRGYAGKISSGVYRKGDKVVVLPAGQETILSRIEVGGKDVEEAFAPQSVVLHLENDLDVSRGDSIVLAANQPNVANEVDVLICWLGEKPLQPGSKYLLQHNSRLLKVVVREILHRIDVNTLEHMPVEEGVKLNEVVSARIKTSVPLVYDAYSNIQTNGAAIFVDETGNSTVAAVLLQ